jgi:hypothetical protein
VLMEDMVQLLNASHARVREAKMDSLSHNNDQDAISLVGELNPAPDLPNIGTGKDVSSDGGTEQPSTDHAPERRLMSRSSSRYDTDVIVISGDDPVLGVDQEAGPSPRETLGGFKREETGIVDDMLVHCRSAGVGLEMFKCNERRMGGFVTSISDCLIYLYCLFAQSFDL